MLAQPDGIGFSVASKAALRRNSAPVRYGGGAPTPTPSPAAAHDTLVRRNAERACRAFDRARALACTPNAALGRPVRGVEQGRPAGIRLPKEGHAGRWQGEPGQSDWHSYLREVQGVTAGASVRFRDNFPDFKPYAQAIFHHEALNGTDADFRLADAYLAGAWPQLELADAYAAAAYRHRAALSWHHHEDAMTLLLVPRALHENIPHAGGASLLRHRQRGVFQQALRSPPLPGHLDDGSAFLANLPTYGALPYAAMEAADEAIAAASLRPSLPRPHGV